MLKHQSLDFAQQGVSDLRSSHCGLSLSESAAAGAHNPRCQDGSGIVGQPREPAPSRDTEGGALPPNLAYYVVA